MTFVAVAGVVVALVLLVLLGRSRGQVRELHEQVADTAAEREHALAEAATAAEQASVAQDERDDALDRVQRARRDAADVANRLQGAVAERNDLQDQLAALHDDLAAARSELDHRTGVGDGDGAALWALTVDRVERLWRTSIAVHPEQPSPVATAGEPLAAVLEVLADAAHEESGADIVVEWSGEGTTVPPSRAVVVAALVEGLIGGLAKCDERVVIDVRSGPDGVEVAVEGPLARGIAPASLEVGAGRYRVT